MIGIHLINDNLKMDKFWKINKWFTGCTIIIFILLSYNLLYFQKNMGFLIVLFFYIPFIEIIQFPLCLLVFLFTFNNQKKGTFLFLILLIFTFLFKVLTYFWIMSGYFR